MGSQTSEVDLFVVGADFYSGSTKGRLKDGWCNFRALGRQLAIKRLDSPFAIRKVWYLTAIVSERDVRHFEEHHRQDLWLRAQGKDITCIVINSALRTANGSALSNSAAAFQYQTEEAAILGLRGTHLAPRAMVISGDLERQAPLLSFLEESYRRDDYRVLVPPDFDIEGGGRVEQFKHDELRVSGLQNEALWAAYLRSRDRRFKVDRWTAGAVAELRTKWVARLDNKGPTRGLVHWQKWVDGPENLGKATKDVDALLVSHFGEDRVLAQERRCVDFIARSLISDAADAVFAERWGRGPGSGIADLQSRPIRSGPELVVRAATAFPAIELCPKAESQIRAMTGNEQYFSWLLEAFAAANLEMRAWAGGPFPHSRLPGPAAPSESDSVIMSPRLRAMRYFRTRADKELPFFSHMKCHAANMRIHYRIDQDERRFIIGYIGEHLPLY